jgi:hypothetical protein
LTDDTPTVTANRVERASTKKKRRAPIVLIVIPIVLIAVAAGAILLFRGGDAIPIIGNDDEPVPEFDFTVGRSLPVVTANDADREALKASAEEIATEITPTIDDLYTNAFLDPSNWQDGDYEEVLEAFTSDAAASVEQNVETLTLGAAAGDVFDSVDPGEGTLSYRVLFDRDGNPDTAVVAVSFTALGERKDGTFVEIVSEGQFFVQETDGWKITAFDVTRSDEETEPPPSPSGSTSPSA